MKLLMISGLVALTACRTVPTTTIHVDPERRSVEIKSPKDVEITGFQFEMHPTATGTVVRAIIEKYRSQNNVEAIKAIAEQNAEAQTKIIETGKKTLGFLIDAAK